MRQISFSRLWDGFASDKEAMQERNKRAKELKAEGYKVRCWTMPNQMKKYDGLGQYNGGVCNVYMINFEVAEDESMFITPYNKRHDEVYY